MSDCDPDSFLFDSVIELADINAESYSLELDRQSSKKCLTLLSCLS